MDNVALLAGRDGNGGVEDVGGGPAPAPAVFEPQEGTVIVPADELRWSDEQWQRAAVCVKTLLLRDVACGRRGCGNGWATYYVVNVECARRRGVEV